MATTTAQPATVAVLAEKPSVARDIARVLGASQKGDGYLHGNGYVVAWAIGHLASLAQPHEIRPEWKQWRRDLLPMLPREWPLVVYDKTRDQFDTVRKILNSPRVASVVCATDAGREGELIFRYIYEAAGASKPFQRLWISSLTPDAIRKGFDALRPGSDYDALADAARGRSRADWLVGMNLSRAYSLAYNENLSVGRVQTPTLAMVAERELAIRAFVPEDYLEVVATFHPRGSPDPATYQGTCFRGRPTEAAEKEALQKSMRLAPDGGEAKQIVARARTGKAAIESMTSETQRMPPPLLYDLTELQRHANRLFGFSAQKTLDVSQALYERHKLISYPRTDSRHLSADVAATLGRIVNVVREPYREHLAPGTGERPLSRRYVDDTKVTDHHAIIPTATPPGRASLAPDEGRIYDLICRRLLSAWHDDYITSVTTVITAIVNGEITDRYHSSGTVVRQMGWKVLDLAPEKKQKKAKRGEAGDQGEPAALPSSLAEGQRQDVVEVEAVEKKTRPPRRFTEATLLTAMETAGRTLDEKELSDAMKETGLGTPATRASIIEVLLKREYIIREGKSLVATDKGIRLIEVVHPEVKSPAMTGQWEAYLKRIQRGSAQLRPFIEGIENYVREVVGKVGTVPVASRPPTRGGDAGSSGRPTPDARGSNTASSSRDGSRPSSRREERPASGTQEGAPPSGPWQQSPSGDSAAEAGFATSPPGGAGIQPAQLPPRGASVEPDAAAPTTAAAPTVAAGPDDLERILHDTFGFPSFRPNQQAVCEAAVAGRDVLLVMPTGSGKSLCYQLPGIARGGTTLVISPLIALMEDQVEKLKAIGLAVERIHSGRDRGSSRQAALDYLHGRLQFLFIAPERLRVTGFPEMLAKRRPSLIAIDEAHCISQWGHDFRPDYRKIGEYLPSLRPAPVVALTATATSPVQSDIAVQLGLVQPALFIHGFRRDNIAIEAVEVEPGQRADLVADLLDDAAQRPAIVYAPTRRQVEALASQLGERFPCQPYHAGLTAEHRNRVQHQFLTGKVEVMVATIAFGMGIDKPDIRSVMHTALPGSLEAYYQEIGRAGRDGLPSRAILMHSYADRYTHDFFIERDYPEPAALDAIFARLTPDPQPKEMLARRVRLDAETFDKALEKLWIHGGAVMDFAENVTRGHNAWRPTYIAQGEHKRAQIDLVLRYAQSEGCRMSALVRHFGDLQGARKPCGICDFCAPSDTLAQPFRDATPQEEAMARRVIAALDELDSETTGRLYAALDPSGTWTRDEFEQLLGAMARASLLRITDTSFEKNGRQIPFRRVSLTEEAEELPEGAALELVVKSAVPRSAAVESKPRKRRKKGPAAPKAERKAKRVAKKEATPEAPEAGPPSALEAALRVWRLGEARRLGVPAFRILTDATLRAVAERRPSSAAELLAISGIGLRTVEQYGARLFRILGEHPKA